MAGNVEIVMDASGVEPRLHAMADGFGAENAHIAETVAEFAAARMRAHAPHGKTGALKDSISVNPTSEGRDLSGRFITGGNVAVATAEAHAPYAEAVDQGSGIFGPKRKFLDAGHKKAFKMDKEGTGPKHTPGKSPVYSRFVAGQEGSHFVFKAYEETNGFVNAILEGEVEKYIKEFGF